MSRMDKTILILTVATILGALGAYLKGQPVAAGEMLLSVALFLALIGFLEALINAVEMGIEAWQDYKNTGETA